MVVQATPRLADRHDVLDYLQEAAQHLLAEREARYPAAVSAGKLPAADAAAKLELARCLLAQWTWAIDPERSVLVGSQEPGRFGANAHQLAAEVTDAAARARQLAERDGSWRMREIADLYEALAWWQRVDRPTGDPYLVYVLNFTASFRDDIRAQRAAPKAKAA